VGPAECLELICRNYIERRGVDADPERRLFLPMATIEQLFG
jgi:hypothetical protein